MSEPTELAAWHPWITSDPGVLGGAPCIRRTRIAVWQVEEMRRMGMSPDDVLREYPGLTPEDMVVAIAYAMDHEREIDEAIAENETS